MVGSRQAPAAAVWNRTDGMSPPKTKSGGMHRMELLSAGQMAALNQTTKKALRLYEQKGLLEPAFVDPETGYRYYSMEQCPTLDTIQQMQSAGFSLAEMKEVLDNQDLVLMRDVLERKTEELERRAFEVEMAKHSAHRLIRALNLYENKPTLDRPALEWIRRRKIVRFDITPYQFLPKWDAEGANMRHWEIALRETKQQFVDNNIPLALFHNVGCIVSQESLADRTFMTVGSFITDEPGFCTTLPHTYWEDGYYLTVTIGSSLMEDGSNTEHYWMCRLLDIAEERGYRISGDYYSDMLLESPLFAYEKRDMMMRCFLPVDLRTSRPRPIEDVWE